MHAVVSDAIWRWNGKISRHLTALRGQEGKSKRVLSKIRDKRASVVIIHILPKVDSLGHVFVVRQYECSYDHFEVIGLTLLNLVL